MFDTRRMGSASHVGRAFHVDGFERLLSLLAADSGQMDYRIASFESFFKSRSIGYITGYPRYVRTARLLAFTTRDANYFVTACHERAAHVCANKSTGAGYGYAQAVIST
jgi:hypothetical protein